MCGGQSYSTPFMPVSPTPTEEIDVALDVLTKYVHTCQCYEDSLCPPIQNVVLDGCGSGVGVDAGSRVHPQFFNSLPRVAVDVRCSQ